MSNQPCEGCNSEKYFSQPILIETPAKKTFQIFLCGTCQNYFLKKSRSKTTF